MRPMLIPSGVSRVIREARVTRAKVPAEFGWARWFSSRDKVPLKGRATPRGNSADAEGPTTWTRSGAAVGVKMPTRQSSVERNRERELGLDRRETG